MRTQITERTRAGQLLTEPPHERNILIDAPALQILTVYVINFAECALLKQLLRITNRGLIPVSEANHMRQRIGGYCQPEHFRFLRVKRDRLLQRKRLSVLNGVIRDRKMINVRRADRNVIYL